MEAIRFDGYSHDTKISNKLRKAIQKEEQKMGEEERELLSEIKEAYREMATTFNQFERATEPQLIEYYTYKFKADQIKYGYLIRCMKDIYNARHRQ